jgi:hypothetical protein
VSIAGIAPFLKVCFGERGPKQVPRLLEISPRVFKIDGGAVKLPACRRPVSSGISLLKRGAARRAIA